MNSSECEHGPWTFSRRSDIDEMLKNQISHTKQFANTSFTMQNIAKASKLEREKYVLDFVAGLFLCLSYILV